MIDRLVAERRQAGHGSHAADGAAPRDLFDVFAAAAAGEEGIADRAEKLGDQIATIIVAGHDTTATALFWALYLLAAHPHEQERLAAEAAGIELAPAAAAEAVPLLVRTRAVVDEVLRLYPPAFVIVRRALDDDQAGGVAVPARSLVLIAPWVLHRHRRLWHDPDAFDPARFLPGAPPPPRFAYMPFGAGPRTCVGAAFALTELVLALATLLRAFRIELAPHGAVRPTAIVTIQPEQPPPFVLRPRSVP